MTVYYPGETISKYIYFKDKDNNPLDPDNITVEIYDSTGKLQGTTTLTKVEVGKYELNYNIPVNATEGTWYILVSASKGSFANKEKVYFDVEK